MLICVCVAQRCNYFHVPIRSNQAGRIPPRSQSGGEAQAGGGPWISQTQQTRCESREADRHTLTFTFDHRSLLCGNLLQASSPFSCYSSGSSFLSLPPSLCPFILQSYKKAIDEVSDTRVPLPPLILSRFSFASIFRAPPPFFTPSHDGVSQEDDVFLSFFSLLKYQGIMAMGVHVCFYTHTWENVCGRVCVCVWPDVPSTPEQSLKLFFLFLYCHHYWSGGAGKPTVYGGPTPRLHDLLCSIRWVEWGGGEPRASWHGDDWSKGVADCCSPPVEPPAWLSVLSSSSSLVFTMLINCSWAVQSADLWSLLMSERENYIMWLSRKMWSQMSTVVTGHLMFKKPGCLCDNKKQLSSCHDADGSSHFLSPLCSPLPCMWFGLSLLRFWDW